ncbi:hypothetical protein C7972_13121 [Arenibacter sp. ARW7G5Y1]|nr:hypothetical protein C7972_13121 [Arenibacter sp. ARW7G5Y1]
MDKYPFLENINNKTMNFYFDKERSRRAHPGNAVFTVGRDEYLPIPKSESDSSQNLYNQNAGY